MVVYDDKAFKFILALRMISPHYKVGFVFVNLVFASVALHFQPLKTRDVRRKQKVRCGFFPSHPHPGAGNLN